MNCEMCGKPAMVGVETPARWLCLDHFTEWLQTRSQVIASALSAARGTTDLPGDNE